MNTKVIKGVDDEIEFKGFKGRYFYQLAGTVVGLLNLIFLLYSVGLNSFLLLLVAGIVGIFSYTFIKLQMDKNGRYGHLHSKHKPPRYIIFSQPFHKLIP
jgi:hypothetical protein